MSARILVVEDNPTNLDLMMYLLRAFGHTATSETDGAAGLKAAERGTYDLILSDVLMPHLDGYELARRYKAQPSAKKAPLVAVTALAMVGDRERLLAAGFDGYIAKPIDPETFVPLVEKYLPPELRTLGPGQPLATGAPSRRESRGGPAILAVDDIQVNLDLIVGSLEPFGYRIIQARSVHEGFERALQERPSVILCDLHMPDGDGFELLAEIKASPELSSIPFFFLSSTSWRTSDQIRGLQLGARKFLLRPLDPQRLREEVEQALAETHHAENPGR